MHFLRLRIFFFKVSVVFVLRIGFTEAMRNGKCEAGGASWVIQDCLIPLIYIGALPALDIPLRKDFAILTSISSPYFDV